MSSLENSSLGASSVVSSKLTGLFNVGFPIGSFTVVFVSLSS